MDSGSDEGSSNKRAGGRQQAQPARKKRLTSNLESVEAELAKVVALRGQGSLTRDQTIDILHVYFAVYKKHHEAVAKTGRSKPAEAVEQTALLLGRAKATVAAVVKQWSDAAARAPSAQSTVNEADALRSRTARGNFNDKAARVPHARNVYHMVRDHVREKRMLHERITATQVMEFLMSKGIVRVAVDTAGLHVKSDYEAALRATRKYLQREGFRRGMKTGKLSINPKHIAQRDQYLSAMKENRALGPAGLREVYLDESYIHQHYHRLEDSVWDPNDTQDTVQRLQHKGRRYCILAAIQNESQRKPSEKAGIVPGSRWTFCPQGTGARSNPHAGDYHKNFNGVNFAKWWREQLLPGLREPSLIIMDNAAYHKTKPTDTPVPLRMKKDAVVAKLTELGVPFERNASAVTLKVLLKKWVDENVPPLVVQLAEAAGHKVLFTPPHYSDLQPIELLWALIKGNVGRQYSKTTTFADVLARLNAEFDKLETPAGALEVKKLIDSVDKHLDRFTKDMEREDELLDDDEEQESDVDADGYDSDE